MVSALGIADERAQVRLDLGNDLIALMVATPACRGSH